MIRTLADDPVSLRAAHWFPGGEARPTASVRAPCCGRRTSADAVLDLRGLAPAQRTTLGCEGDWMCDVCRSRYLHQGRSRAALFAALGAPPDEVAELAAHEDVRAVARSGEPIDHTAAYLVAVAARRAGHVPDPTALRAARRP